MTEGQPYRLGQLLSLLEKGKFVREGVPNLQSNMLQVFTGALKKAASKNNPAIEEIMTQIDEIPDHMGAVDWSFFWLGYYHQQGGNAKPVNFPAQIHARVTTEQLTKFQSVGSEALRAWLDSLP